MGGSKGKALPAVQKGRKPNDKSQDLVRFQDWLRRLANDHLQDLLADAFWKDQLKDTELHRFFLLENEYGVALTRKKY